MVQDMKSNFSVLMPLCQREDLYCLFDRSIGSVLANTILPDEIVVVLDGQIKDQFLEKILGYKDLCNLRIIETGKKVGLSKALNIGLNEIKTKWVMRVDGDDFSRPDRFKEQVEYLSEGFALVGGGIREIDINGLELTVKHMPIDAKEIKKYSKYRNPFNHMTVAFCVETAKKLGGYPDLYLKEDYGLWAVFIANKLRIINSGKILVDATAGKEMYRRRFGFSNIISEFMLQIHLIKCRVNSPLEGFPIFAIRTLILILPPSILRFIYINFLRKSVKK